MATDSNSANPAIRPAPNEWQISGKEDTLGSFERQTSPVPARTEPYGIIAASPEELRWLYRPTL